MTAIVTRGDAGNLHLPDETVDLIVTSPPYFGLRSYQDGGEHYTEQIGAEATPVEYLDALMACTAEWMRVLKPGGSIFVNLGDSYFSGKGAPGRTTTDAKSPARTARRAGGNALDGPSFGIGRKSLIGTPWRYAIRCIDELGLILRAEIVWAKPNGLPESVTDRVRRSHEQVFHFVKQPRYYSAVDEIREEYAPETAGRYAAGMRPSVVAATGTTDNGLLRRDDGGPQQPNALGKLPGSVWSIPTAPLRVPESLGIDHFAAYPPELVRRIVLGWSPREVCTACREGRRPVKTTEKELHRPSGAARIGTRMVSAGPDATTRSNVGNVRSVHTLTGYACACPDTTASATPGVVLDPFGGTGTTALVASVHGRIGISNDLSTDYCRLAQWRTTDEKQRAKAAGMKPKPPKKATPNADVIELPGQLDITEEWTA